MSSRRDDQLPKKRVAAGALFFNPAGEILLVKPTYQEGWGIPGGVVEMDEAPKHGCRREIREELGVDLSVGSLLVVDYTSASESIGDSLQFVFDGGILGPAEVARLCLPEEELSQYRFVSTEEALTLLRPRLRKRLPACLRARETGRTAYLHDGEEV